jgi:hypothetical protein
MFRALLLTTLFAAPAFAEDPGFVTLPETAKLAEAATPSLLTELVVANVVGMNCPAYRLTDGEWALLTGSADKVATAIGVADSGDYDTKFYGPAFDLLDKPETCDSEGPKIAPLVERLKAMGGDTTLLKPLGG